MKSSRNPLPLPKDLSFLGPSESVIKVSDIFNLYIITDIGWEIII